MDIQEDRLEDWKIFGIVSDMYLGGVQADTDIEEFEKRVREGILMAAELAIPKSSGSLKRRAVPWWDEKCSEAVKNRNRAFRVLKRTHNYQHMIEYKRRQAVVRRTIRESKRTY